MKLLKLAAVVMVGWYILRNPTGAAGSARDLWALGVHLLSVGTDKVGAFVSALTR
jgi:hypothetical protein